MCGRFALALRADEIEQLDAYPALRIDQWVDRDHFAPRYNVAPRTRAPVIRRAQPGESALVMHSMKWGLVPHWSKAEPPALNTINARAENLEEGGGMWGSIKGRKRCVVVAQGYYEWLKKGTHRVPHFTRHKDRRLMLFAGLYDSATLDGQSEPLWTFTIVTTAATSDFAWLHDRQPVILTSQHAIDRWLDTSTQNWDPKLSRLLDPYSDSEASPLECYAVPQEVGRVGVESPTFIEPVEKRKDGIEALFSRQAKATSQKPDASPVRGKRKREPSPLLDEVEGRGRDVKTERPIAVDDDDADAAVSDVEILPSDDVPSQPNLSRAKPKTRQGDNSPSTSRRRQSPPPTQTTTAPKRKLKPTTPPSTRKKQEKSEPAKSTPKITSFFAKT
jgi:putative SOS response-associated peptidase YedK